MILSSNGKSAAIVTIALAAMFGCGFWCAAPDAYTVPANSSVTPNSSTAECRTEIVPAPKNRASINGVLIESDQPITVDITRTGPSLSNQVSGTSTSAGLTTPNGEATGAFNASAGSPNLPSIWGSPLAFTLPGGSALSFEFTPAAGLYGFAGLGVLFLVGAVALWYFTRNVVLAACVGGIGVALISIGLAPELWAWSGLAIGAFGLCWLGIHIWRARGAKKSAKELTEYDELAAEMRAVLTAEQIDGLKKNLPLNLRSLFDGLI